MTALLTLLVAALATKQRTWRKVFMNYAHVYALVWLALMIGLVIAWAWGRFASGATGGDFLDTLLAWLLEPFGIVLKSGFLEKLIIDFTGAIIAAAMLIFFCRVVGNYMIALSMKDNEIRNPVILILGILMTLPALIFWLL